jgi:copper resistance protein B
MKYAMAFHCAIVCGLAIASHAAHATGSPAAKQQRHQDHAHHPAHEQPATEQHHAPPIEQHREAQRQGGDHSSHPHHRDERKGDAETLKDPLPTITDADRAAAFPEVAPHGHHGDRIVAMVLVDRLEAWSDHGKRGQHWELQAWAGGDLQRVWLRSSGEREDHKTHAADIELLYGRSLTPWWDLLAGVRHDTAPGPAQTWAAVGVHGMAPYKFEIEATAYVGRDGRSAARFEAEYEVLLTNRLILQPAIELELHDRRDHRRDIGAGLSKVEAGLRLRYEIKRRFAPYIGFVHERIEAADGQQARENRLVGGLRLWF